MIGLIGLGKMGRNLALNFMEKGEKVIGYDHDASACRQFVDFDGGIAVGSQKELLAKLPTPRTILLLIPAGGAVDEQLESLLPKLARGDLLVDVGNSHYKDSLRRESLLIARGIGFVGLGLSGGERGARLGPSLMVGGRQEWLGGVYPKLSMIAAQHAKESCIARFGGGPAGHFVKMVHNGLEYAEMQLIAEIYYFLRFFVGLKPMAIAAMFTELNRGPLASYLLEISGAILETVDPESGLPFLDLIVDVAKQNGTGYWAAVAAMELGVAAPSIAEAVYARNISASRPHNRKIASKFVGGALKKTGFNLSAKELSATVFDTMLAGKLTIYAQGFAILAAGAAQYDWLDDFSQAPKVWRAGCIIQCRLLDEIDSLFTNHDNLENLLEAPQLYQQIAAAAPRWQLLAGTAMQNGVAIPVTAATLAYWHGYNSERLWTDMIQAQRDAFGGHGFLRTDRPGQHHGPWRYQK